MKLFGEWQLGIARQPEPGEVLINEILFNPYTGGSDFVEIYNASDKVLDLKDLILGEIWPGTDSIFNTKEVSNSSRLFTPGQLICLTANVDFQKTTYFPPDSANFHEMSSFPSYDDNEGESVIATTENITLDRFAYEDDLHFPTLQDKNGVSLERISLDQPSSDPANWHSAAGTVNYATPGYANSQRQDPDQGQTEVWLEKTTFSPNDDGQDDVLIINYNFDFIGGNARILIFDAAGRPVRNLQDNILLDGQQGSFFWDGRDDDNTKADIGMYVVLFEVVRPDTGKKEAYRLVSVLADRL